MKFGYLIKNTLLLTLIPASKRNQKKMGEQKRILLVENSRTALAGLTLQLEAAQYIVEGVRLGAEAILKVQEKPYFAIIMDIFMPQMNGYEAAKHIRDLGIQTPIFALTGSQDPRDKQTCLESGMNAFLPKSEHLTELFEELNKLLKQEQ